MIDNWTTHKYIYKYCKNVQELPWIVATETWIDFEWLNLLENRHNFEWEFIIIIHDIL